MKKNVFVAMLGAIALALGVGLNTQNALNDYGIGENSLSLFVQAQTKTTSSGGGGYSTAKYQKPETHDCVMNITGEGDFAGEIFGCKVVTVKGDAFVEVRIEGAQVNCREGGDYECKYRDCVEVFEALNR